LKRSKTREYDKYANKVECDELTSVHVNSWKPNLPCHVLTKGICCVSRPLQELETVEKINI